MRYAAILFDLDGTLVDSAPDLAGAANEMRVARAMPELDPLLLRSMVGSGARGMVFKAFGVQPGEPSFEALKTEFLDRYAMRLLQQTQVFEHMHALLDELDRAGQPWGIVTNKAARFTTPLVEGLGLARRAKVVVSGDTTAHTKPHPAPLLAAAQHMRIEPGQCAYVGDDLRDMQAGRAAGMATAAATWGYLGDGLPPSHWQADVCVDDGHQLLNWLALP